jgi:hypothetical protein
MQTKQPVEHSTLIALEEPGNLVGVNDPMATVN